MTGAPERLPAEAQRPPGRRHPLLAPCLLLLSGSLLAGCALIPELPTLPTPVRPPDLQSTADALQAALDGTYPLDALQIRYEAGSTDQEGRTTLAVSGRGPAVVSFSRTGQQSRWDSTLAEDQFLALCRLLVDHRVWDLQSQQGSGSPDPNSTQVIVEAEGFDPLSVWMSGSEALEHPDFKPIVQVMAGLAREISGGVAP